jgi:hypothetical protein
MLGLRLQSLIRYIVLQNVERLQLKKRLLKDISFLELVAEQVKLENAKLAIRHYLCTTTIPFAASA